jgi:hypothetical protein
LSTGKSLSWAVLLSRVLDDGAAFLLGSMTEAISETQNAAESVSYLRPNLLESSIVALREMMIGYKTSSLVIEDDTRSRGEPILSQFPDGEIALYEDDVYHVGEIGGRARTPADLELFIGQSAFGYPLNGFAIHGTSSERAGTLIEEGGFDLIAERCDFSFHSIYDGDAIAVWLPSRIMDGFQNEFRASGE